MNLRKNLAAKLGAVAASVLALAGTLVLVHRNPPASADTTATSPAATATPAARAGRSTTAPSTAQTRRTRTHTRTHVS